ncbi:MAG: protein kinase [Polyangia bacterium]
MQDSRLPEGAVFANRFEVERLAGQGGMGAVYRAHDRHSGEQIALKLLHGGSIDDSERFLREAQLLAELHHPGIVSYRAHGQAPDGQRFLAMEWLEGETLGQRLLRGPLLISECLTLLQQVADALAAAHQKGVIHRDLKPANLFLISGDSLRVKLLDFGIARKLLPSHAMTRTGMVIGTPEYMAPEQARGLRELTPAADMFSLGCVLYECLTGQPPFVADHIAAVLVRILFEEPVPIDERRNGIPRPLQVLLGRLLRKEPTERFSDAVELRDELVAVASALAGAPEPALAATLAGPRMPHGAFAESEQSLLSIVLAAPPAEDLAVHATVPKSAQILAESQRQALQQALTALGVLPSFLANGTLVVTTPTLESAHDQARQAARAAMLIRERWAEARITMATGRGTKQGRMAMGEVVEQAAHALRTGESERSSARSGVLVDVLTAKLLQGQFAQTPQSDGALLLGEEKSSDASRPLLGRPTPCVGRDAELAMLEAQLSACIEEGAACATLVTAPPGIGKSRLRHEFVRRVQRRSEPLTLMLARGEILGAGAAYGLLAKVVRALCGISGSEPAQEQRQRLSTRISAHLDTADSERVVPFLGEVCGIPFPETEHPLLQVARQTPKSLPDQLRRACLLWLAAECRTAPLLIILDDLHWGDELTVMLIDQALQELRAAPLFVLALARPEVSTTFPGLWKLHKPQEIALKPLGRRACERLIEQALGKKVSAESVQWIIEQSTGNALFLEELIRAAAEGQLHKQPETVVAMLQARIGHLPAGARRLVLAASVFGQTLWHGGIAAVLGLSSHAAEIESSLVLLSEAEMIEAHRESRLSGQREYGFRHALIRDAAYGLLTENDRRLGHQRAAEFFENTPDTPASDAVRAYHLRQAGLLDQAVHHYLRAGDRAARLFLSEEARLHYAAAEETARAMPDTPLVQRLRAEVLSRLVQCSLTAMPPPLNLAHVAQARALLESLQRSGSGERADALRLARLDYCESRLQVYLGQMARAEGLLRRLLPVAHEFEDQELVAISSVFLGQNLLIQGHPNKGRAILEPVVGSMERLLGKDIETQRAYLYLGNVLSQSGRCVDGLRVVDHVRPWGQDIQQPGYRAVFYWLTGTLLFCAGDWPAAIEACMNAVQFGEESKDVFIQYIAWDFLAYSKLRMGDLISAQQHRHKARQLRRSGAGGAMQDVFEVLDTEILLNTGQAQAAADLAERLVHSTRATNSMTAHVYAERSLAYALARLSAPPSLVDAHLRAGFDSAEDVGHHCEATRILISWGQLCSERGDRASAAQHFRHARERITDQLLPYARDEMLQKIEAGLQEAGAVPDSHRPGAL